MDLGSVSVVMMPWAALNQWSGPRLAMAAGRPATRRSSGSGSRMTPVEKGRTSAAGTPSSLPSAAQVSLAFCRPSSPVPALALPVLMTSALIGRRRQMGLADLHRRGAETVAREHARHAGAGREAEHGQIASVGFADAGLGNADFNAGNRENFGLGGICRLTAMTSSLSMSRTEPPPAGRRVGKAGYYPTALLQGRDCRVADRREGRERAGGGAARGGLRAPARDGALGPDPDRGHIQHAGIAVGQDRAHRAVRRLQHELPAATSVPPRRATRPREAENSRSPAGRRRAQAAGQHPVPAG